MILWEVLLVVTNQSSMVGGIAVFPRTCAIRSGCSIARSTCRKASARWLSDTDGSNDEEALLAVSATAPSSTDFDDDAMLYRDDRPGEEEKDGWIRRMMDYLRKERAAIFRGRTVAVIVSSSPPNERRAIESAISGITEGGAAPRELYFVVSPQQEYHDDDKDVVDEDDDDDDSGDGNLREITTTAAVASSADDSSVMLGGGGSGLDDSEDHQRHGIATTMTTTTMTTVETIDFDDELDTEAIDVVVLSTKSWRVVHDDPFVNDFLRRTDAWIHMGSEFGDDYCYYARLQEGANITLW